jgi:hypothetical protein
VRQRRVFRIRLAVGLAALVLAALAVAVGRELWRDPSLLPIAADSRPAIQEPEKAAAAVPAPSRPTYPHSIIAGGAYTRAEVAAAVQTDAVVAAHYRSLDVDHLRPTTVDAPRAVYVSYRIGNEVYWTKRPVRLARGETLLTDGESAIRARCGNRVSEVAQYPVAGDEPELDTQVPAAAGLPDDRRASSMAGEAPARVPFFDAWSAPIVGGVTGQGADPGSSAPVSAGGAVSPLLTGLGHGAPAGGGTTPDNVMTSNGPGIGLFGGRGGIYTDGGNGSNAGGPKDEVTDPAGSPDGGPHDGGPNGKGDSGGDGGIYIPPGGHDSPTTGGGDHTEHFAVETTGGDGTTTADAAAVPEPATLLLMGLGAGAALARRLGRARD